MSRFTTPLLGALALALVLAIGSSAAAQSPSEAALARQAFRDGVVASRQERWSDAVELFQRSFELSPRPLTMMNLAGALAQTDRLVEAAEAYRSFLTMSRTGTAARLSDEAEAQLRELEGRIPRVRLRVLGMQETDIVRLDEYDVSPAAIDLPLPVDPGAHTVTLVRGDAERSIPFTSAEGVAQEIVLDVRPEAWAGGGAVGGVSVAPGATTPSDGGPSLVEEPAFWIVLGVVVAAGIAVGVGVGVGTQGSSSPYQGNLLPMGIAL